MPLLKILLITCYLTNDNIDIEIIKKNVLIMCVFTSYKLYQSNIMINSRYEYQNGNIYPDFSKMKKIEISPLVLW